MSGANPSAGVVMAAKAIDEFCITADLNDVSTIAGIAEIIDRETGVAELLKAAKRADEWFKWFYEGKKDVFHPTWNRLKRAIAKAEGADTNSHEVRKARGAM